MGLDREEIPGKERRVGQALESLWVALCLGVGDTDMRGNACSLGTQRSL